MFSSRSLALLSAVALAASACSSSDSDSEYQCGTSIHTGSIQSPSAGVITVAGDFETDEDVFARYKVNGQTNSARGTFSGSTMTFTGIPSSVTNVDFYVSCDNASDGQEFHGSAGVTVK